MAILTDSIVRPFRHAYISLSLLTFSLTALQSSVPFNCLMQISQRYLNYISHVVSETRSLCPL